MIHYKSFTSWDIGGTFIDFFYHFFILLHQQKVDAVVNLRMAKVSITWYKNPRPTGTRTQGGWQTMRALYHRATGSHTRWRIDFSLELLYIQPTAKEFVPICVNYTLGANCNLVANRAQAGTRNQDCLHTVPMLYRWATEHKLDKLIFWKYYTRYSASF